MISVHGNITAREEVVDAVSLEAELGPIKRNVVRISGGGAYPLGREACLDTGQVEPANWSWIDALLTIVDTSADVLSLGVTGTLLCLQYKQFIMLGSGDRNNTM